MSTPAKSKRLNFSSRKKWRAWLAKNHRVDNEIWLVYDKKLFQTRATSYRDFLSYVVEEAICYGWIDSRVKRIGQTKLGVRFTPRRSRDNWSKYNRMRALKLLRNGKMTKAGTDVHPQEWLVNHLGVENAKRRKICNGYVGNLTERRRSLL